MTPNLTNVAATAKLPRALPPFAQPGPAERAGYVALLVYMFLFISRILDISFYFLRIPLLLSGVLLVCTLFSGHALDWLRSKAGIFLAAFTAWVVFCVPFSIWRGGSFQIALQTARGLLIMIFLVALLSSTSRCLTLMRLLGYSLAVSAALALIIGERLEGRLVMPGGTYSDPNTFCLTLVMGLPFLWMDGSLAKGIGRKLPPLLATIVVLWACLATGSRSGLLALLVVVLIHFFRLPAPRKLRLMASAAMVVLMMPLVLSDYLLDRFRRFSAPGLEPQEAAASHPSDRAQADYLSLRSRQFLLLASIEMTLRNPVVGVGPGQFQVAEAALAGAQGRRGAWHDTHNTYTQVSSETGIPGLLLLLAALGFGLQTLIRITKNKPSDNDERWQAIWTGAAHLQLSMAGVLTGAFFLNIAYSYWLPVLIGLAIAYHTNVQREMAARLAGGIPPPKPPVPLQPSVIGPAPQYRTKPNTGDAV
jgi:O-antigen ligase